MWKNCKSDIQGLYHYRRFISGMDASKNAEMVIPVPNILKSAISEQNIIDALKDSDVILMFPCAPYPMTGLEELRRWIYWKDIQAMYNVLREYYPDYSESLEHIFSIKHISCCNIFIARRKFVDDYCTWLFDVLGKLEQRISSSLEGYDTQHKRVLAILPEYLLNVYIHRHNLRRKYFQLVRSYGVSPLKYYAKKLLKKIPGTVLLADILFPRRRQERKYQLMLKLRYESMQRFIAGTKSDDVTKVTDAYSLKEYVSRKGPYETELHENDGLLYSFVDMANDFGLILAVFLLKDGTDIQSFCEKMRAIISDKEAQHENTIVVPEIICGGEISANAREALAEEGASIVVQ